MKRWLALGLASFCIVFGIGARSAPISLYESFDNVAGLPASGWSIQNVSAPLGATSWFQGNPAVFTAQSGAPNSYAAANFLSTDPLGGTISTWLISPEIAFASQLLSFFTRSEANPTNLFGDGLRVLLSMNGASTALGDFTQILEINAANVGGAFPDDWTQFTALLASSGTGRIAFQYTVGPNAIASYIGLDTVSIVSEPATLLLFGAGMLIVVLALRRRGAGALVLVAVASVAAAAGLSTGVAQAQPVAPRVQDGMLVLPNVRVITPDAGRPRPAFNGEAVKAFIDPQSGDLVEPSFEALDDLDLAPRHRKPEPKAAPSVVTRQADGSHMLRASSWMTNLTIARRGASGRIDIACTPADAHGHLIADAQRDGGLQ